jgi:DNA-directed RNA polymerase specialized sigma24 family protein
MDLSKITPWIDSAATFTYRAYASWISLPDVKARLWLWTIENETRVDDYLSQPDGERIVRSILSKEARTYALKERAVSNGVDPADLAWYSVTMIRKILPDVFDYEDWQSFESGGSDGRGSKPVANATGDRLAYILDIKGALTSLQEDHVGLLREHYGKGVSLKACAIALGISDDACQKRLQRAVYAIADKLNGVREHDPYEAVNGQFDTRTKGRKAMSNAAARAATDANWSE